MRLFSYIWPYIRNYSRIRTVGTTYRVVRENVEQVYREIYITIHVVISTKSGQYV